MQFEMKNKLQRQVAIRRLVSEQKITSQEELRSFLEAQGFELTQATLSRDIKSLKIAKAPSPEGGYMYVLPQSSLPTSQVDASGANFLADGFLSVDFSGNMVVIKTKPAYASSIAALIDGANPFELLGTIAGDDTIFIVTREGIGQRDILNMLVRVMPKLKGKLI
jgi:transcriptional regulator of arginine metabolism